MTDRGCSPVAPAVVVVVVAVGVVAVVVVAVVVVAVVDSSRRGRDVCACRANISSSEVKILICSVVVVVVVVVVAVVVVAVVVVVVEAVVTGASDVVDSVVLVVFGVVVVCRLGESFLGTSFLFSPDLKPVPATLLIGLKYSEIVVGSSGKLKNQKDKVYSATLGFIHI